MFVYNFIFFFCAFIVNGIWIKTQKIPTDAFVKVCVKASVLSRFFLKSQKAILTTSEVMHFVLKF